MQTVVCNVNVALLESVKKTPFLMRALFRKVWW